MSRPAARAGLRIACLALLAVAVPACSSLDRDRGSYANSATQALAARVADRLEIGRSVAWYKYQNNLAVHDPAREQTVLDQALAKASELGVAPEIAGAFFTAQMAASRRFQSEQIRLWSRGGTLPAMAPVDLARDIRPKLDALTVDLLNDLRVTAWDASAREAVASELRVRGFSRAVVRAATGR